MSEKTFSGLAFQDMDEETKENFRDFARNDAEKHGQAILDKAWENGEHVYHVSDPTTLQAERFRRVYNYLVDEQDTDFILVKDAEFTVRVILSSLGRAEQESRQVA